MASVRKLFYSHGPRNSIVGTSQTSWNPVYESQYVQSQFPWKQSDRISEFKEYRNCMRNFVKSHMYFIWNKTSTYFRINSTLKRKDINIRYGELSFEEAQKPIGRSSRLSRWISWIFCATGLSLAWDSFSSRPKAAVLKCPTMYNQCPSVLFTAGCWKSTNHLSSSRLLRCQPRPCYRPSRSC